MLSLFVLDFKFYKLNLGLHGRVASKKQLSVVFYAAKPPKARSEPSRRLAEATDRDYATVEGLKLVGVLSIKPQASWSGREEHLLSMRNR